MPQGTAYPFGMRDIKITPITNPGTEAYGTAVDLPAARTLSFTEAESYTELRGDDSRITSRGSGPNVSWELEAGGYSAAAVKAIYGQALTETGVTPNQISRLRRTALDSRPFFKAEGQAMSDSGGDFHVVLYRCRATGDFEGNLSDGEWFLTNASGEAFPSVLASPGGVAGTSVLYDIIQNETVTAIV